jgi:PAS domain S-box-containing protein
VSDVVAGRDVGDGATRLLASRERLEVVLGNMAEGVMITSRDGRVLYANAAAARLTGAESPDVLVAQAPGEARARFHIFGADRQPVRSEELPGRRAFAGEGVAEAILRFHPVEGGPERVASVRAVAVRDESGGVEYVINFFRDVTDAQRRSERDAFVAEAGAVLGSTLDVQTTLRTVAELAVPGLFDHCSVHLVADGRLECIATVYGDQARTALARRMLELYPPTLADDTGPGRVARTGERELLHEVTEADLAAVAQAPEHLELLRAVAPHASAAVPIAARGQTLGVLTVAVLDAHRELTERDVELAEAVARAAAGAIENARLFAETRRSEALLDALFASAPVGLGFWDRELRFVRLNEALARINGLSVEEHIGRRLEDVVPGLDPAVHEAYRRVVETGRPIRDLEVEGSTPAQPGVRRAWHGSYYPVFDERGATVGVGAVVTDITDRRRSERRLRVQHAVTAILTEAERAEDALPRVLEAIAELLEWDAGAYWEIEAGGDAVCRSVYTARDVDVSAGATVGSRSPHGAGLVGEIWRTGEPQWIPDLGAHARLGDRGDAAPEVRTGFGFAAVVAGEVVGVLEFFVREKRQPDPQLLDVAAALGRNVGQFVQRQRAEEERARLLVAEQEARAAAESAVATLAKLERVTEVALEHVTLHDLLDALLGRVVEVLAADTAAILLLDPDGAALTVRATRGLEDEFVRGIPVPVRQGLAGRVAASRAPLLVHDLDEIEVVSPALRSRGLKSVAAIPLVVEERVIGVVHAGSEQPAYFTTADVRLLELIADRIALAINHSALSAAEREAQERLAFIGEASTVLASSLEYEQTLAEVARLVAGRLADWCAVDVVADNEIRRLAVAHADPEKVAFVQALLQRRPPSLQDARPGSVGHVLRTGEAVVASDIPDAAIEEALADLPELRDEILALGLRSYMIVPIVVRGKAVGAFSFATAESGRRFSAADLPFAQELASRAAIAVDNARLYREAAERAQAARVLASVGDGVVLVDHNGVVRYWNRAAAAITGLPESEVVDSPIAEAFPGWSTIAGRAPVAAEGATNPRPESLPLALGDREVWLSVAGVEVPDGIVYAFRDLTEDRALDEMKTEFVSTVSHELRTPLAAIYGAAVTLRRTDVHLDAEQRENLLSVVSNEADRLARTVNAILWASRLDTDTLRVTIESCDPVELTREVVTAQAVHLPPGIELRIDSPDRLPPVAADRDKVGQVLVNLVENGVKYSPDGGTVLVRLRTVGRDVRFSVVDEGLGIPHVEQRRIFEKFYRLDPNMTRGIGGTGLGLYICRELVRRMGGRIWVESAPGRGSTFTFELAIAAESDVAAHLRHHV